MSHDWAGFSQCYSCRGAIMLSEEHWGVHPVTGRVLRFHARCHRPEHRAIPVNDWFARHGAIKCKRCGVASSEHCRCCSPRVCPPCPSRRLGHGGHRHWPRFVGPDALDLKAILR